MYEGEATVEKRIVHPADLDRELTARLAAASRPSRTRSTRGKRRMRPIRMGLWLVVPVLALLAVAPTMAVHDTNLFELDGNAVDNVNPGDDWQNVFNGTDSALVSTFIQDADSPTDTTYFTGGGSKDINDVSQWLHDDGDVAPDKDEILDAFAAAYNSGGELIIYFGLDRFADNGDAQVGFWFFHDDIGLNADGTFDGVHAIGDLLVLSDFTNGGNVSTIRVFQWVGAGGSDGPLDLIATGVQCSITAFGDGVCAQSNTTDAVAPWPYTPKSGTPGVFPSGSFYEGGINLTDLGLDLGCGGSFLAETRSSQSVSAQLKDFALGSFALCGLEVTKTGDTLSKVGDSVNYEITIENTGSITLFKQSITDTLLGNLTANAGCGASLAPGATCTINTSRVVQAGDPDPLPNTVTAIYDSEAGLTGDEVTDSDGHSVNLFQPSVTIDKTGDTLSKVGDTVNYTITVNNTSSADSPNLVCDVNDTLLGLLADDVAIAAGGNHVINTSRAVAGGDPDPLTNTATVTCSPVGFPNVLTDSDSLTTELFQPGVTVDKTGPTTAGVGDTVTYSFTITNTSSADAPDLVLASVTDTVIGDLTAAATAGGCGTLASPGGTCNFTANYTIQAGDPNPLVNVVTVLYHPEGFPNDITDSDDHSLDILALEGCTPGFWKGHTSVWNSFSDPLVDNMPAGYEFITTTSFNDYFNLTPAQSGFSDSFTMLDAVNAGGGGGSKLARHGVSALLNIAADIAFPFTDFIGLYDDIRNAYLTGVFEPLATQLAAANSLDHQSCPTS